MDSETIRNFARRKEEGLILYVLVSRPGLIRVGNSAECCFPMVGGVFYALSVLEV
jgi:hypothetical protein